MSSCCRISYKLAALVAGLIVSMVAQANGSAISAEQLKTFNQYVKYGECKPLLAFAKGMSIRTGSADANSIQQDIEHCQAVLADQYMQKKQYAKALQYSLPLLYSKNKHVVGDARQRVSQLRQLISQKGTASSWRSWWFKFKRGVASGRQHVKAWIQKTVGGLG